MASKTDDITQQINATLDLLDQQLGGLQHNMAQIQSLAKRLCGVDNVIGYRLGDIQCRRYVASANAIAKLPEIEGLSEFDRLQLTAWVDGMREIGQRRRT